MELTPAQKHLIRWLKVMDVGENMICLMLLMDKPRKRDQLMCWKTENQVATPSNIMRKALE